MYGHMYGSVAFTHILQLLCKDNNLFLLICSEDMNLPSIICLSY